MAPENYCLDDTSFIGLLGNSANFGHDIHALADVAEGIIGDGQPISVPDSIEFVKISDDLFFYDLYSIDFSQSDTCGNLDRDTLERLLALRRKLDTISVTSTVPVSLYEVTGACAREACVSGIAEIIISQRAAGAVCFALLLAGAGKPLAGEYNLHIDGKLSNKIYVLRITSDVPRYARWLIRDYSQSEDDFFSLWERAFPLLFKSDDLTFHKFDGTYMTLHNDVLKQLVFLNDSYLQLWSECDNDFPCIKRKAKSGYEIDFSNESVSTRSSKRKMKKRTASFSMNEVVCELHTKISYNKNRIHFHPPIEKIGGEKILIGIFVDHLET